jgi:hypothetical protein
MAPGAEATEARSMMSPEVKPLIVAAGIAEPTISSVPLPASCRGRLPPMAFATSPAA